MPDYTDFNAALTAVNNPATPAAVLAAIAQAQPSLRANIARHPNSYPELVNWINTYGGAAPTTPADYTTPQAPTGVSPIAYASYGIPQVTPTASVVVKPRSPLTYIAGAVFALLAIFPIITALTGTHIMIVYADNGLTSYLYAWIEIAIEVIAYTACSLLTFLMWRRAPSRAGLIIGICLGISLLTYQVSLFIPTGSGMTWGFPGIIMSLLVFGIFIALPRAKPETLSKTRVSLISLIVIVWLLSSLLGIISSVLTMHISLMSVIAAQLPSYLLGLILSGNSAIVLLAFSLTGSATPALSSPGQR